MAFTPWVWFGVFLAVYAALGFWLFGGLLPPVILAIGSAGSAWLQIKAYRHFTRRASLDLGPPFRADAAILRGVRYLSHQRAASRIIAVYEQDSEDSKQIDRIVAEEARPLRLPVVVS